MNNYTHKTQIEGIIGELYKKRYQEFAQFHSVFEKMNKDADILRNELLMKVGKPKFEDLKKHVIAVDGSSYQEQYESIAITIATAYVYMSNRQVESYLPSINIVPPYYASLVNSIRMRTLEYKIAKSMVESLTEEIDLIFLDGAITFPDEAIGEYIDNVSWVKEAYIDYKNTVNTFFNEVIKKNIPVVGIIKDSMSNKYFTSLYEELKNSTHSTEIDSSFISNQKELIKEWGPNGKYNFISEKSIIRRVFGDREFCRTKYVEVTCGLRNEVPAEILKNNVLGFYFKISNTERPFFIEIPSHFEERIDEIMQLISSLSYYSLRRGYPLPLYAAHKKVELKKKSTQNLTSLIKNFARKDLKNNYRYLFEELFHEKL